MYNINLTEEEVALVTHALQEAPMPLKFSFPLLSKIQNLIKEQRESKNGNS